jgi:hypothetical protein
MPIRVNRVLSKKENIAGIPAEIFLPIISFDVVAIIILCIFFSVPFLPVVFICLTINIVWAILVSTARSLIFKKKRRLSLMGFEM